ncbi:MAG: CPBP family intramembrane metalloprotease [Acidobacteriota bacterium]|nr:CPBP family intramembrane metalloprotease [Acidobacteriota bacterium]
MPAAAASASSPGLPPDDGFAQHLRGFGPIGILAILVILASNLVTVLLSAVLVLLWARRSGTPWREIGYVRPKSWIGSLAIGLVFGTAFKLVMKIIVMPLLGADPINHPYHYLVGNRAALPGILFSLIVGAGFGEETVYRGYMFERLGKLLGPGWKAKSSIVLLTAAIFALAHYSVQGLAGSEQAMITGTVFGVIFLVTGSLWLPMCAHAAFDLTSLAIIYWDLETAVAHLVFK